VGSIADQFHLKQSCFVSDCKNEVAHAYAASFISTGIFPAWTCEEHSKLFSSSLREMTHDELLIYNILND
jgi:hypothetical protein